MQSVFVQWNIAHEPRIPDRAAVGIPCVLLW